MFPVTFTGTITVARDKGHFILGVEMKFVDLYGLISAPPTTTPTSLPVNEARSRRNISVCC